MPYADAVRATVEELDQEAKWGDKKKDARDRFLLLFRPQVHQRPRKIQRLQSGFLPNALGFASFVDLRPDFGDTAEITQVQGYVPVVQLRITTDSSEQKTFVFQVSEEMLADLKKTIERAETKLATLKEKSPVSAHILKVHS